MSKATMDVQVKRLIDYLRNPSGTNFMERPAMQDQAAALIEKLAALPDELDDNGIDDKSLLCGVVLGRYLAAERIRAIFTEVLERG